MTRKTFSPENLKKHFNMSIESTNKTLEQYFAFMDEIVTKENIKKYFYIYQTEKMLNFIDKIDNEELYTIYTYIR